MYGVQKGEFLKCRFQLKNTQQVYTTTVSIYIKCMKVI